EVLERVFAGVAWVSRNEQPIALADSDPQPDVMVVSGRFEDYTDHPTSALLLAEVADSTLDRDTTTKAKVYVEAGIAEYWVLDRTNRCLPVCRPPAPLPVGPGARAYPPHITLGPADRVTPLAAPGGSILVGDLLP